MTAAQKRRIDAGLFTIGETAEKVGLTMNRYNHLLYGGYIAGPQHQIQGHARRYYSEADVVIIRGYLEELNN